jgi:hypothetical protein
MAIAESFLRSSFVGLVAGWFQIIPPQSNSVLELGFAPRRADGTRRRSEQGDVFISK